MAAADRDAPRSPSPEDAAAPVRDDELDALFAPLASFPVLILAVSGGADSVALMHLTALWLQHRAHPLPKVIVATVDHGLREGSRAEAEWVIGEARALGFAAALLTWTGEKPATGVQDAAREVRYRLLADLARGYAAEGRVAIVTAHTEDDQAETLLMRLARGSGLDGLAAMAEQRAIGDDASLTLLRPLLGISGARLRATLTAGKRTWIDDPSNDAERFERVRIRKARALLAGLGLSNDKLALSARRLARAKEALDAATRDLRRVAQLDLHDGAFASFDRATWLAAPEELRLRLLGRLITAYGGQPEPLRLAQLEALAARMAQAEFEGATLAGAIVSRHGDEIRVLREGGRAPLPTLTLPPGASAIWDRRFRVSSARESPTLVEVRAFGLKAYAQLRHELDTATELPADAAATLPAFWREGELIIVPMLAGARGAPASWREARRLYSAEFLG